MSLGALADAISLAMACAMLMAGAATAWRASNAARRIGGIVCAHIAAVLALAILGAPAAAVVTGVALSFVYCVLGVAVLVRLQETYASTEAGEIDAADEQAEPAEPST
jgi:hypothetical protein